MTDSRRTDYAKRIFTHYLRTAWENAGLTWNYDNTAEVHEAIDCLMKGSAQ